MRLSFILTVALLAFFMSGCMSRSPQAKNSGFFKDYKSFEKLVDFNKKSDHEIVLKKSAKEYKNVIVSAVQVISTIEPEQQTALQKKLYKEIGDYLNAEYKKSIQNSGKYRLVEKSDEDTLVLESAISVVEVHPDDEKWSQFSPVSLGLSVVSANVYMDGDVRLLGEKRLVDAQTKEVISQSMSVIKDIKIIPKGDELELEDLKPALNEWIMHIK
ncbi:DUF3313 family protein [Sulfurimonas sp.]|uniref:DUF3313 family protein n=2 Tax=Sulfurimonas sp. TaxID=2022749 RepID=UPI002610EC63|nr:DUF3313 family protein [Sulfurimonas sp.]MDD5158362.1 DUF3313 family protein [Sulfurimonas sp.]